MAECCITPVGCLKDIGKSIFTQSLWPPIKSHVDYWWCFDNNIKDLTDEIGDLERKIYDIEQKIEEARLRTDKLRLWVEDWLLAATEKLWEARRILQDDINPKAWNLISRYSMGKRAKKAAEEIAKLQNDGNFNAVADPPPPHLQTMKFNSRTRIEEDIIESLTSNSFNLIGIYGMGGVGKTTMVQKILKRVEVRHLFDEVVMVVVGQQKDMLKIQEDIAECLGLKFDVESMPVRAHKLRTRLMDIKRKIIIFDDIWESINLEYLGVPFESGFERCKILLTTRSKDVCERMEAQKIIVMPILTEEESWILMKEIAGDFIEDPALLPVAKDVVAECKGLPFALVTCGKSLQNRGRSIWMDALFQLRRSKYYDE